MEDQVLKIYTVKPKKIDLLWLFKYNLNGDLISYEIQGGVLDNEQIKWLFGSPNFPFNEERIKSWIDSYKNHFDITVGDLDLSFDAFWNMYNYKVGKKVQAQNTWKRLSKKDKTKALLSIRAYNNYLSRNNAMPKAYPNTYLNQRYFENEYKSAI